MSFSLVPEYGTIKKRYDAFWNNSIIDRALTTITLQVEKPKTISKKTYKSFKDKWLDIEYRSEEIEVTLDNNIYLGDALPIAFPNMGPEIFSAWCGCDYNYSETTTWSEPCIIDWETDEEKSKLDIEHPLFKKTMEFTELLLKRGKNKFITGLTDFHSGGDHLAALRDPEILAIDMLENVDYVKEKLKSSAQEYFAAYDIFYNKLKKYNLPITTWLKLIDDKKYYVPSNDFSIMISTKMFEDIFLEGIIDETKFFDRSIYHLDGVGALRHLDTLLDIKTLDAIQFVPGDGNIGFSKYIDIYQKIQAAKKGMHIYDIDITELPLLFETLKPEGIFLQGVKGVQDRDAADSVLKAIEKWSV